VRWGVVGRIATAWVVTLPAAAIVGGLAAWVASTSLIGLIAVAVAALACGLGLYALSRRNPVTRHNVNDTDDEDRVAQRVGAGQEG
jgi:PiT family inorganic phosphate transporter